MLSVGVDNTTNSLVVACPTTLFTDIKALIMELDTAAGKNRQVVKIVPVNDIDPYVLQAAIDAEPEAREMLEKLSAQNRFALAFRTHNLKTPTGRKKKIRTFVEMLKCGETIYPQAKK